MLRYSLAAAALKAFSLNAPTKRLYRHIGNVLGGRQRERGQIDLQRYIERGNLLVELYRKYETLTSADRLLELGTGWMHWYSIYLRMAHACRITTLDVWDNRQLGALKACFSQLPDRNALLDGVLKTQSFEELYALLGFDHVIIPGGSLDGFEDESFTSVFSMHVLEHVPKESVQALIEGMFRTMRPGHHTIHQIGIDDHLAHYDSTVSRKKYITFSNRAWTALFENEVQYINRLQPSDWIRVFESAGFTLVHREQELTAIDGLQVSKDFQHYSEDDLACTILTLVFRKR